MTTEREKTEGTATFEQMFGEAEETLRRGMDTLSQWGDQAREVMQNRPGVILASISIAGFMTGLLLRQGQLNPKRIRERGGLAADPMVMFLTGALAGFTLGPRVLREVNLNANPGNGDVEANAKVTPMRSGAPTHTPSPSSGPTVR